jgi:hypothetical protein
MGSRMIDMSTWEELTVDVVDELHLDPNNVRIEQLEGVPEADIIHDLFSTEKAFALVEGIVKVGLLTHEVPIVVRRGKKLFVVRGKSPRGCAEGNSKPLPCARVSGKDYEADSNSAQPQRA